MSQRHKQRRPGDSLTKSDVFNLNLLEEELMSFDPDDDNTASRRLSQSSSESDLQRKKSNKTFLAGAVRRVMQDNMKRKADKEILQQVIKEVETVSAKRMKEGLNQWNFSIGVFNCFFIVYIFGKKKLCYYFILSSVQCLVCVIITTCSLTSTQLFT